MKRERTTYRLAAAGLLALIAVLAAVVAIGAQRDVPDRDIPTPAPAFAAGTMYVAPGETGDPNGGDDDADEDSDTESDNVSQDERDTDEDSEDAGDDRSNEKGSGSGQGGARAGGTGQADPSSQSPSPQKPPQKKPDPDSPGAVIPGILTNLGNYRSINANTPAPNKVSITLKGKSGLSRTSRLLYFYALPENQTKRYSVLVEYANDGTNWKQTTLSGSGGLFGLPVVLSDGARTDVTLTLVDANGNRVEGRTASYRITYEGRKGPTITLNVKDGQRISIAPFALTVSARDADNAVIYPDHIDVKIAGAGRTYNVARQGSADPYEYRLDFTNYLLDGDDTAFEVTVRAWDSSIEQASTTVTRRVVYEHHAQGEKVGEASIVIDATPVGLGVVARFPVDLHQGFPFPQDLIEGLNANGLRPNYSGTFGRSFYLSGITSGGLFAGQALPSELKHKIDQDKITYTESHSNDSLSDRDYTNTSGWLYNVNNSWWPSVSLDGYTPSPGDTVYLIFSVAGGKDVGSPAGGTGGALSSYCGIWRNGTYTEQHDLSEYKVVEEPTCAKEGRARYVCSVPGCGAWGSKVGSHADGLEIVIPATGNHSWKLDPLNSEAPAEGMDGFRHYVCETCGASYDEVWPWVGKWPPDDPPNSGGSDNPGSGGNDPGGNSGGSDDPGGGGGDDPGNDPGGDPGEDPGGDPIDDPGEDGGDSVATQAVRAIMRLLSLS